MPEKRVWGAVLFIALACVAASPSPDVRAELQQSNNYKFEESVLGGGGLVQSNSANYQVGSSLGESIVGGMASDNFQSVAGNQTTKDPVLSFSINNYNANFGNFSAGSTATATATFSVSNYTSYGYVVQVAGNTPTNGLNDLPGMGVTAAPTPGIEEFGMNLVANTVPTSVGANPDHGQFGIGSPSPNYGTPNQYRYVNGETIAIGPKTSGVTQYTISYIANVDSLTPGGIYASNQVLICTGTF